MKGKRRDGNQFRVYVKVGTIQRERRFPLGTPDETIKRWRDETRLKLRRRPVRVTKGTLLADVEHYLNLESIKRLVSRASLLSELTAWTDLYGHLRREDLTRQHVLDAREQWIADDYAPKTINHRVRALRGLFHRLDGSKVDTPCDDVEKLPEPAPNPQAVTTRRIRKVAKGLTRWPFEQAVFLVLTSTGQRPAQLKRTRMNADDHDVDIRQRVWWVRPAKGGNPIPVFLNDDMLVAWKRLLAVRKPGPLPFTFDTSDYDKKLYAAGWPKNIRPYNAKHTVGIALAEAGAEWEDIKDWFGHKDSKTTRIYTGVVAKRLRATSQLLAGRLNWQTAKGRQKLA